MPELTERVAALEMLFGKINLGDWSNDQDVPWWLAPVILPQRLELQAELHGAIHLAVQAKAKGGGEAAAQLVGEIVEGWCGTPVPGRFPPRPHWGSVVAQLGALAERLPGGLGAAGRCVRAGPAGRRARPRARPARQVARAVRRAGRAGRRG